MTPNERNVLITTCFGHFLSHFNMLVFPAVMLPLATGLNLPLAEVLGISFWMYLLFGITALPWGLAAGIANGQSAPAGATDSIDRSIFDQETLNGIGYTKPRRDVMSTSDFKYDGIIKTDRHLSFPHIS